MPLSHVLEQREEWWSLKVPPREAPISGFGEDLGGAHRDRDPAWTVVSERENTRACRETQQQGTKALEARAPHLATAPAALSFCTWVFRGVFMG